MSASGDPPKWVTLVTALVIFLLCFIATYFGAAFLGGMACGAAIRFQLPWAAGTCRYSPSVLLTSVYFLFLFNGPVLIGVLRNAVARVYRLTIVGGGRDA